MDQRIFDDPRAGHFDESRTVILTGRDLRDASRLLRTLLGSHDREAPASPHDVSNKDRKALVERARQVVSDRRRRVRQFGSVMFGEPGWDILLTLYTEEDKTRFQISRLLDASGSPATTGLRWLDYLEAQQLVCRQSNPTDGRSFFVELTDKGRGALDSYFSETLTKGP